MTDGQSDVIGVHFDNYGDAIENCGCAFGRVCGSEVVYHIHLNKCEVKLPDTFSVHSLKTRHLC